MFGNKIVGSNEWTIHPPGSFSDIPTFRSLINGVKLQVVNLFYKIWHSNSLVLFFSENETQSFLI